MISSSAAPSAVPPTAAPDMPRDADFAPPAAPMAMPKQVLEQAAGRSLSGRLRLPFLGSRVQGQS